MYIFVLMKKYTIKDIAELAGVSKGTVDRVIHKRGKVSEKALKKVSEIIDKIDYKPNLLARSLKNNQDYHICVVLPDYKQDPFWKPCYEAIIDAIKEYNSFGIFIEYYFFDLTSSSSFLAVNKKVLELLPNAVLLAPLFYSETIEVVANYKENSILVSKFNNQLHIENSENFVGQDLYKSGRIAASLMGAIIPKNATVLIIHVDEDYKNATHIQQKEKGFRNYFTELGNYNVVTYNYKLADIDTELNNLLNTPNLKGIFVTTSKVYKIAEKLKSYNSKEIKIIGYDLIDENIMYLKQHVIHFLIHQNPEKQVSLGLSLLVEHLLFDKEIPEKTFLPIDIINAENIDTYL